MAKSPIPFLGLVVFLFDQQQAACFSPFFPLAKNLFSGTYSGPTARPVTVAGLLRVGARAERAAGGLPLRPGPGHAHRGDGGHRGRGLLWHPGPSDRGTKGVGGGSGRVGSGENQKRSKGWKAVEILAFYAFFLKKY